MKVICIFFIFTFCVSHHLYAQDSSRFEYLGKKEKDLAYYFVSQKIDTFLILKKENFAYKFKDTVIAIYRKNAVTYKQYSYDKSEFSIPIQIGNTIIDSFLINKIAKLNRKQRKIVKEMSKWRFHIFPDGTYYKLNFYFGKKQFYSFLEQSKYAVGMYHKQEFYHWFDLLEIELRK